MQRFSMQYTIIRSNRKTIGMQMTPGGIVVRAPYFASSYQIERFVREHEPWIRNQLERQRRAQAAVSSIKVMTDEQFARLKKLAKAYIPQRIAYYAPLVGVASRVSRISIRCQKTRWGSCTSNGSISINCLLMLAPKEVLDAVIVHELCHLIEMNHSQRFYANVTRVYPEYKKWYKWLKDNGARLQATVPSKYRR